LRELERRFPREIAVVGVHSGKYIAERETGRIREASLRLGATHPVLNDRQFRVWRGYAVRAWPTLVVIDPRGYVVGTRAGEFTSEMLEPLVERMIGQFDPAGEISRAPLHLAADGPAIASGVLRYPGKVAFGGPDPRGRRRIAVADSGHHRVLLGTLDAGGARMRVERVSGTGTPGLVDDAPMGDGDARFDSPQGLAFHESTLFVADAGNHAVRAIDLDTGRVRTLAGTGRRLRTRADQAAGALASPWDLVMARGTLYVAMAGSHQLWAIDPATGRARPHAGGRGEDIQDGPLLDALLAQPMGIATDGHTLHFVDAESSAVRTASLDPAGSVRTIVGTGLFDFGDRDGEGDAVEMQHQQAIALHPSGRLLVADSYNDALKWVDPVTRRASTWLRGFHEPGGLALGDGVVYVADTNAHRVAVVREHTGQVTDLEIDMSASSFTDTRHRPVHRHSTPTRSPTLDTDH
jgi:hypothetical protein